MWWQRQRQRQRPQQGLAVPGSWVQTDGPWLPAAVGTVGTQHLGPGVWYVCRLGRSPSWPTSQSWIHRQLQTQSRHNNGQQDSMVDKP